MNTLRKTSMSAVALFVIAGGSAFGQNAPGQAYQFKVLGPACQDQFPCMGIDAIGRVAGTSESFANGLAEYKAWTFDSAHGYLVSPTRGSGIGAVSPDGVLVGWTYGSPTRFDWMGQPIDAFPAIEGRFMAVNSFHDIAGYFFDPAGSMTQRAVVLDRNGNWTVIGGPELSSSAAYGINDSGTVVGHATDQYGVCRGFAWNGSMNYLPGPPEFSCVAVAVNNPGTVVGYAVSPMEQIVPVKWSVGGLPPSFYTLVQLPTGFDNGNLTAVNDRGFAVGTMWTPGGESLAFLVRPDGTVTVLNDLMPINNRNYTLVSANAINSSGAIVGLARPKKYDAVQAPLVAFVLTPPLPTSSGGH